MNLVCVASRNDSQDTSVTDSPRRRRVTTFLTEASPQSHVFFRFQGCLRARVKLWSCWNSLETILWSLCFLVNFGQDPSFQLWVRYTSSSFHVVLESRGQFSSFTAMADRETLPSRSDAGDSLPCRRLLALTKIVGWQNSCRSARRFSTGDYS